jgi:hypothetical protein
MSFVIKRQTNKASMFIDMWIQEKAQNSDLGVTLAFIAPLTKNNKV